MSAIAMERTDFDSLSNHGPTSKLIDNPCTDDTHLQNGSVPTLVVEAPNSDNHHVSPTDVLTMPAPFGFPMLDARRMSRRISVAQQQRRRRKSSAKSKGGKMEYYDDDYFGEDDWDEEEMPETERELAEDAAWKLIQKNTFTRWANEHLKTVNQRVEDIQEDFTDGLRLIALIEVLTGKKFRHINKKPNFRTQKLENVTMVLKFLEEDEGIKLVNIDSTDIVNGRQKLILGLIWTLILHYSISMPMWEDVDAVANGERGAPTPKNRLLQWVQNKISPQPVKNFTTDWNDGTTIGALVDACGPGLCPNWATKPYNPLKNAAEAMDAAEKWLDVPQLVRPEEMTNPKVDELSMMTYISQFPNCRLKEGAPVNSGMPSAAKVRAYGPGIQPTGNIVGQPAVFTVETGADGELDVVVINPKGQQEPCQVHLNKDPKVTYGCSYIPSMEGQYRVIVKFCGQEIPKSPFNVGVSGPPGDASKVHAEGPGIQRTGNMCGKPTYFDVFIAGAGTGRVEVLIIDQRGRKDTVRPKLSTGADPNVVRVEYLPREEGVYHVNVYFAGAPIPGSAFPVSVSARGKSSPSPASSRSSNSRACYATGRGIQPNGMRVGDPGEFVVHTENAGHGEVQVQVVAPNGTVLPCSCKQTQPHRYECVYRPNSAGPHTINVTFGGDHIARSPFKVEIGPQVSSNVRAFGPGLEGGCVGYSADFTVETNGETGALGFSIEGPSQAKIDCRDNGDGSADVSYWPTAPGEYAVHILCNDEDIPKSPYMAQIRPATSEFDPRKVNAYGPGLQKTGVVQNRWAEFTVDCRQAGRAPLKVTCMDVDYNAVDVQIQDNRNATYTCRYMPKRNVKHTVVVTYGDCNVPKSPFRVYVSEPSRPDKIHVYGPGVEKGVKTFEPTHFVVDCKEGGPGDVAIALTDERGLDVPVDTEDNNDGTFTIRYEPKSVGTYTASVFFADQEIPKSPFRVPIEPNVDLSKVFIEGLEPTCPVFEERDFDVITTGAGKAPVTVAIETPTHRRILANVEPTIDGYMAKYMLTELGPHKFNVRFCGMPIPGSPFEVNAVEPVKEEPVKEEPKLPVEEEIMPVAAQPRQEAEMPVFVPQAQTPQTPQTPVCDPSKVKAYGPGLSGGVAERVAEFTIDTRGAGSGGLGLTIEGPSEAKIECRDNGDGTCKVMYLPTEPGEYTISVTFADQQITDSPYRVPILPSKQVDVRGIRAYGPGLGPDGIFVESTTEFTVDARSVTSTGEGKVKAIQNNPSGSKSNTLVNNNGDGTYKVSYTPFEKGNHTIEVSYEGIPIPRSPFPVKVEPGCDPSRVKAYGPGLQGGFTNQAQQFTIDTRGAGKGGLGLAIEGPSEAEMTCKDNRDGTCTVEYHPVKSGDYDISIKFADQQIPGSPFHVPIIDKVDISKVKSFGPGLEPGNKVDEPAIFTVDCRGAGDAPLEVMHVDPAGFQSPADVRPNGDGTYTVTYVPLAEGPSHVDVRFAGQHVPNSPFSVAIESTFDPSKVRVVGDGIQPHGVLASIPVSFTIDTRDAGIANVDVSIQDPEGRYLTPLVRDNADGTFNVTYTPEDIGQYTVNITFGGRPLPQSPFKVQSSPTGNADRCVITDGLVPTIVVNEECVVTVDAAEAGRGNVTCRIRSPVGSDCDIDIADNGDGTFSIFYTPRKAGSYTVEIKFGGNPVPKGKFTQTFVESREDDAGVAEVSLSFSEVAQGPYG